MALHRITSDEAFHRLVERSQRTNTKLSDVADDLMRSVTGDRIPAKPLSPNVKREWPRYTPALDSRFRSHQTGCDDS